MSAPNLPESLQASCKRQCGQIPTLKDAAATGNFDDAQALLDAAQAGRPGSGYWTSLDQRRSA